MKKQFQEEDPKISDAWARKHMNMKKSNVPTRREILYMSLAIRDAYFGFDQEDYCQNGIDRCENCIGCIQYNNLYRAYKITKKYLLNSEKI